MGKGNGLRPVSPTNIMISSKASGDAFVKSFKDRLCTAVNGKGLRIKDVYEHFLGFKDEKGKIGLKAIREGAENLGIQVPSNGVEHLFEHMTKNISENFTEKDFYRLVHGEYELCEQHPFSSYIMPDVRKNIKILKRWESERKKNEMNGHKRCPSWYDDKSISPETIHVPVEHIMMIKKIEENCNNEVYLCCTMIQIMIGVTPKDDNGKIITFGYRINEIKPSEKLLCKRRSIIGTDENGIKYVKTTFSAKIKLDKAVIFHGYPFLLYECAARIELLEFEFDNLQVKPNIVFRKAVYMYQYFRVRDPFRELFNKAPSVNFLTPYPSVKIDNKNSKCQAFEVSFFAEDGNMMKTQMIFYLPFLLIGFLNLFHVLSATPETNASDYIENASTIALASVFMLPLMYSKQSYRFHFGSNEAAIVCMFLSFLFSLARTNLDVAPTFLYFIGSNTTTLFDTFSGLRKDAYFYPSFSFVFSLAIPISWFWNKWYFKRNKGFITKENGSYEGIKDFNISPDDAEKRKNRRLTVFGHSKVSGKIRKILPKENSKSLPSSMNPGPFNEYTSCTGWSAGFRVANVKEPWVDRKLFQYKSETYNKK